MNVDRNFWKRITDDMLEYYSYKIHAGWFYKLDMDIIYCCVLWSHVGTLYTQRTISKDDKILAIIHES